MLADKKPISLPFFKKRASGYKSEALWNLIPFQL